jgi:heme/copper-type cytochrome/quinol oxidase subunit 2
VRKRCAVALVVATLAAVTLGCSPNQRPSTKTITETTEPAAAATTAVTTTTAAPTTTATPTATAGTTTPNSANQVIRASVTGGRVTPPPAVVDVRLNSTVVIEVTSDVADRVRVQGFDLTQDLQPGQPGRLQLAANRTGDFDVVLERSRLLLCQMHVR